MPGRVGHGANVAHAWKRCTHSTRTDPPALQSVDGYSPLVCAQFGQRRYASLGSLLSHALSSWHDHSEFALSDVMRGYLDQRDLYARLSIKALMPQQQADLLAWAEAHTVLAFIARDGLLAFCDDCLLTCSQSLRAPLLA